MTEKQFIDESINRNQLTGNRLFVDENEQRIGLRVERRGRGRPGNEK
jgi:putative transposase